ncbi:monooxygenase FAD-binding [Parvibaculum lavamentivorans DS-1]|uniref:Monooxygenase FAD-binding n=1 Tax=Parvibaculum lavamentivorans (strain DS-1 / DSM 13023 / NCIMB 13966) TaxID=402881 RepID=A7HXZ3_PARL1|nr:FAD-dependent oxidoreductase [Parvibaculum lavamentivorans]ABS64776.1 monooxygenase FAD-binding [Parvibaculum lavamentivorans DS-1]
MLEKTLTTTCAIAGGGPAGMMLGLLLARAGVDVTVLEKHGDFLRDFRGDTIHPSTLEVMHELGLLDGLLARPHQKMSEVGVHIGDEHLTAADFSHLPTRCKFVAFMPQWDFLDFLAEAGRRYPGFHLHMNAEATGLLEDAGRVAGIRAATPDGTLDIRADLVVGADGRGSVVREKAGLDVLDIGAPFDVLWMRLTRRADDALETLGRVDMGHIFITIDRGDYWQCAFVIGKGELEDWKTKGIEAFRETIAALQPHMADRTGELRSWDDVKLLTVKVDRLREWARDGLLCIGDAAHAMSPVGGVGINLAIQDAVAAANILAGPLRQKRLTLADLRAVQRRRDFPTRVTQGVQVFIQNRVLGPALRRKGRMKAPLPLKLLGRFPLLRRIPGYAVGLGVRPEHVEVEER